MTCARVWKQILMLERHKSRKHPWRQERKLIRSLRQHRSQTNRGRPPSWGRAAAVRLGHRSNTKRARTQPSGNGLTKTIWQAIVVFWNVVTKFVRNHRSIKGVSLVNRHTTSASCHLQTPCLPWMFCIWSQMRPKGMNKGNEGSEFAPTFQSVKGDIVKWPSLYQMGGNSEVLETSILEACKEYS